jgi:hypothetical protein
MESLKEWLFILTWGGFWGGWVAYFLVHKGVDDGWGDRHPIVFWTLALVTAVFYIAFQKHLDWNVPGPNATPCLIAVLFAGIMLGRYAFPKRKPPEDTSQFQEQENSEQRAELDKK